MTDFKNIKIKINSTINNNKKKYFDSKTIADIEDIEEPVKQEKILGILLIPTLIALGYSTDISLKIIRSIFSISQSNIFYTVIVFSTIISLLVLLGYSAFRFSNLLIKILGKVRVKNIEKGKLSKDKITESLFNDLFWKSKINKETEDVLKITLPYKLYLMLYSQKPSELCYLDVHKFIENIERHEKEIKDIEYKRISMIINNVELSDIKSR